MSTKSSIKYDEDRFHLYSDLMDPDMGNQHVNLTLYGCPFEAYADENGIQITVRIDRDTARGLGLLPPITTDNQSV